MATASATADRVEEFLSRTFASAGPLSADDARRILSLRIEERDQQRIHELAAKNQAGTITRSEADELNVYRTVGLLLDVLRSKARLKVKRAG